MALTLASAPRRLLEFEDGKNSQVRRSVLTVRMGFSCFVERREQPCLCAPPSPQETSIDEVIRRVTKRTWDYVVRIVRKHPSL